MADARSTPRTVGGYAHGRVPRTVREVQLLNLAEKLYVEHGYEGFSIEDLCRAAAVSRPVVYDHFGSKDGVYLRVLRRIRDELDDAIGTAAATASTAVDAVELSVESFFSIIERDPKRWSLVYGGSTALVGPLANDLYELRLRTVSRIAGIAERFAPGADPLDRMGFAQSVSGAGEQLGRWWIHETDVPLAQVKTYHKSFTLALLDTIAK